MDLIPKTHICPVTGTRSKAVYSPCEKYRYWLQRSWCTKRENGSKSFKVLAFLMLNCSTATELDDDPTVSGCMSRAKSWGYSSCIIVNLFAYRATDPREMKAHDAPIGPCNDNAIQLAYLLSNRVICAWGEHGTHLNRASEVVTNLDKNTIWTLHYLQLNQSGWPAHPLYLKRDLRPKLWHPKDAIDLANTTRSMKCAA